jgi:5-(carboxyamino)imidazole ribonucleotide synthase
MTLVSPIIQPGATLGIVGGGQLGRMLAVAAAQLGYRCHIFEPDPAAPAAAVSARHICAAYDDRQALDTFAGDADLITYEFENVPLAAIDYLAALKPLFPARKSLAIAQDRIAEKDFATSLGIACGAYAAVDDLAGLQAAIARIGTPAVLKTRRMGYDGKGQARLHDAGDAASAWQAIGEQPAILEAFVPFECEISVLVARRAGGEYCTYGPILNEHRSGILHQSTFPALLTDATRKEALALALALADGLQHVGILAVEMFVLDGKPLLNEMAPRVHNSGHGTIEGAVTSQFENHIRAICGLPLGSSEPVGTTVMTNLIGDDISQWPRLLGEPATHVHLYGKSDARAGRKMGHVTRVTL